MGDTCGDNRFELIEKYKQKLLDATNIVDSPEEMAAIDNILFRFWQMGWLGGEPSAQPSVSKTEIVGDVISRSAAIDTVRKAKDKSEAHRMLIQLPSTQPESKYEYHYDHTDCIWYRPEARNRCPSTCAQYRDGWNDAMNYIFRDGEGYRPFRRDKKYEG